MNLTNTTGFALIISDIIDIDHRFGPFVDPMLLLRVSCLLTLLNLSVSLYLSTHILSFLPSLLSVLAWR